MEVESHPYWAQYANRIPAKEMNDIDSLKKCIENAEMECPYGLDWAMRYVGGSWEWYAPTMPNNK